VSEPQPVLRDLPRLDGNERALFEDLRGNRLGVAVRLEQEKIGFGWVRRALEVLQKSWQGATFRAVENSVTKV
jgi:hypothetical protein